MDSIFCERLKQERIQNGLTQQQLADSANSILEYEFNNNSLINKKNKNLSSLKISRVSINRYENGKREPEMYVLYAIAEALDVQIDYLLGKSNFKKFDSDLMKNDIFNLIEKTDTTDKYFSKLIRNIVDTCYLTVNSLIDDNKIDELQIIHDLYKNIFDIKIKCKNEFFLNELSASELNPDKTTFEQLKIKNNELLDKLYNLFLHKN